MRRGRFITLEGSEGAGKSTNVEVVCEHLSAAGIDFYRTREPGGTDLAEALRETLLASWQEQIDGLTELLLVFAARNQHLLNEIKPRLQRGQWIVCDRFTDASFAYQGTARGVPEGYIKSLESWVQQGLQPDLTIYLDVDPALAAPRIAQRDKDRMEQEKLAFFVAVRAGYLQRAAQCQRIQTIDAGRALPQVQADVARVITSFVHAQSGD